MLADGPGVPITPVATAGVAAGSVGSNGTHQASLDVLPHSDGVPMAGAPACSQPLHSVGMVASTGVSAVVTTATGATVAPEVYDAPALYDTHTPVHVMGGTLDDTPRPAADRQATGKGPGADPTAHHATVGGDEHLYRKSHSRMAPPGSSAGTQPAAPEPDWHTQRVASDEYGNGNDATGLEDDFGHDEVPPLTPGSLLEGWHVGDRYDLQQLLGRGAYGEVAMAFDKVTKTKVCCTHSRRAPHSTCLGIDGRRASGRNQAHHWRVFQRDRCAPDSSRDLHSAQSSAQERHPAC